MRVKQFVPVLFFGIEVAVWNECLKKLKVVKFQKTVLINKKVIGEEL